MLITKPSDQANLRMCYILGLCIDRYYVDLNRKENKYEKFRKHDKERITRGY